jgi:hypothetical protein
VRRFKDYAGLCTMRSALAKEQYAEGRALSSSCFKPGRVPWNKGKRGLPSYERTAKTRERNRLSALEQTHKNTWTAKYNRENKAGVPLSEVQKEKLSVSMTKARATYAPIWNKGLVKENHPSLQKMAETLSVRMRGKPRPYVTERQGIRRFWYYGSDGFRIRMRSRWEVAFAKYLDKKGVSWIYEPCCFVMDVFSYTPDFWVPLWKSFVEIKGYLTREAATKIDVFRRHYRVALKLLMGEDLQKLRLLDARYQVIRKERRAI